MDRRVISLCLSVSLMLLFAGCSGKKVASSSGDQSSQSGQAKTETIQPEAIKTVPMERSFDRPSGNVPADFSPSKPAGSLAGTALGDVFFDFDRFQIDRKSVV